MIVVSDTSPVRGLIALNRVELLYQLFDKVVIPTAVESELLRISSLGQQIRLFLQQPWVEVKTIVPSDEYQSLLKILDKGESEAIILAKEIHADLLLMDENKGRKLAQEMHLKVLGLIGVLIKAKKASLIVALKPELDSLINQHGFWIQKELYQNILKSVDEF